MLNNTKGKLNTKAMLVTLSMSQWTARKYDKKVTKKVEKEFHAENSGRFNKILVNLDEIKKVQKVAGEAREYHYEQTLPWGDTGARILPVTNYMKYMEAMREFKDKFESEVKELLGKYNEMIDEARTRLNGMFSQEDYPVESAIKHKYDFRINVSPLPDAEDFRVTLQGDEVEKIQKDIEGRLKEAQNNAIRDLWDRLYSKVSHMAERLSDPKAIFKNTLIQNTVELCEMLPRLNITEDPELEKMRLEVESKLCGYKPDDLRKNKHDRAQAAKDAQSIIDSMAGYIG